jgi:hypothetical protein
MPETEMMMMMTMIGPEKEEVTGVKEENKI